MPKVKLIRNCVVKGDHHVSGKTIEVSEKDARTLISLRRAVKDAKAKG